MKKIVTLTMIVLFGLSSMLYAQDQPDTKEQEKIRALEIAFISRKLNLTENEAQRFWPIYNEYKRDVRQVMLTQRNNPKRDVIDDEQMLVDVRKRYKERFVGVIGQPRMNKFFEAEREFRGVLLNQLKNRPNKPVLQRRNSK
ncbi:hypothetical protein ESA94_14655 [Lacibacter luteus]|uniref:Sensor of ECF-type sigma factor n=1 Tax=Lacibacter luteus TaxID=2508719 RepID=A0A4Q1CHI3_9BACT|nr:hypothetical protein [Lacibacter luteus]RXK59371.1 hypothetical protein ESA94_14655 [Lacibacter luteus]